MKTLKTIARVCLAALACCGGLEAALERHVRIVLDTSQSMRGTRIEPANDPSGLALISTAMFYDLAKYELGADGTFKLHTFESGGPGHCPSSVPKSVSSPWTQVKEATRTDFVNTVLGLRYDAPCTYFSPYLNEAARDLEATRSGDDVKRIIVLITDGLTEENTRAEEQRLLEEVARRLHDRHIDLYVLAFGATANTNGDQFRRIFRFGQPGGTGGEVLTDPGGRELVENMIRIFKAAFAYQSEVVAGERLNLADGLKRHAVAVLAHYDNAVEPSFSIEAPTAAAAGVSLKGWGTAVGRAVPDVVPKGASHPISYGIRWVVDPTLGEHRLIPKGPRPSKIAILRPINVTIRIRPAKGSPPDVAMVGTPMRLRVDVTPAEGGSGDPGAVTVQFRTLAVKTPDGYEYAPSADWVPAAGGGAYAPGEGRGYDIRPEFGKSAAFDNPPRDKKPYYDGYIEARAQVDGNVVASTPNQHQVRIYPWLSLRPDPDRGTAADGGSQTLQGGETGCVEFTFHVEGTLDNAEYSLSAVPDTSALAGPLAGAEIYLDGTPLKAWENGRKIGRGTLATRKFSTCIAPARRTSGGKDLTIPIRFSLWQAANDPYKQLDVVQPFYLMANVEPAGFLQRWTSLLLLLLTLLVLALLYWLLVRLGFPDDFRSAVGIGPDTSGWQVRPPAEAGVGGRMLGRGARPVLSAGGNRQIGQVVPLQDELYVFRPEAGYHDLSLQRGQDWVAAPDNGSGEAEIAAHRMYRVRGSDGGHHYFRIEYEVAARETQ